MEVEGLVVTNAVRSTCDVLRRCDGRTRLRRRTRWQRAELVTRMGMVAYASRLKRYSGIVKLGRSRDCWSL